MAAIMTHARTRSSFQFYKALLWKFRGLQALDWLSGLLLAVTLSGLHLHCEVFRA